MSKQTILTGAVANNGLGDPIRDAFVKVNANFTELYARQSPVAGQGAEAVISAVKMFEVSEINRGELFFIGDIIAGTLAGGHYTYTVDVYKTTSLAGTGDLVMRYTTSAPTSPKTGLEYITLAEYDGSGLDGHMIINWSELTQGTDYQLDDWTEGGLYAIVPRATRSSYNPGSFGSVTADNSVVDGSKAQYVLNPSGAIDVFLDLYANIVGDINLVNVSAFSVSVYPDATENTKKFNGNASATGAEIHAGESITIRKYSDNYLVVNGPFNPILP